MRLDVAEGKLKQKRIFGGVTDFILEVAPKSLQMVTAAKKLKDACSWGEKLGPT